MLHLALTDSLFSQMGEEVVVAKKIKVIFTHEILVVLFFLATSREELRTTRDVDKGQ